MSRKYRRLLSGSRSEVGELSRGKFKPGDICLFRGARRVVAKVYPDKAKHQGHQYYGIRLLKSEIDKLGPAYINKGWDGQRRKTRIYWVRSDRLKLWNGVAVRQGTAGRPLLQAHVGPRRITATEPCICGQPKSIGSRSCQSCRWRFQPKLVCSCGGRKESRALHCRACQSPASVTEQTHAIVARLKELSGQRGSKSQVAREFKLSRERIGQIAKRHLTGQ